MDPKHWLRGYLTLSERGGGIGGSIRKE